MKQKGKTSCAQIRNCHSLIIESTASAGGVAKLGYCLSELLVELVGKGTWHTIPCHDENDDDGVGTVVPCPVAHQTHQLLFLSAAPDHLRERDVRRQVRRRARKRGRERA